MNILNFQIENIDGCEFIKSSVAGNMMISFYQNFDSLYTGEIHVIYADGSQKTISQEEAQKKLDSREWTVIR